MNQSQSPEENQIGTLLRQNFQQAFSEEKRPQKKLYRYPYLDAAAINQTIQNGKRFAEVFNMEQEKKSDWIHAMNSEMRKINQENPHTAAQKIEFLEFKKEHKLASAEPMAYNTKILEFNRAHGTHFLLRTYRRLRNEVAVTFSTLVFFYAAQIRDNNARKLNAGVSTAGTLPRMLTNSESLKRHKVEGVPQNPYKNDAILKHVHNLVEAGLLINYKSHGRNMGFSVDFNPEILAVQDAKTRKKQLSEKQIVTNFKRDKHPYSDCITGTYKDKNENKGDAVAPQERNAPIVATSVNESPYGVIQSELPPGTKASEKSKNLVKKPGAAPKKQDQEAPGRGISAQLEGKIRDRWELCQELSENQHVQHIPIDSNLLEFESLRGSMSQAAFRELLFQEFMKAISRLKKENQSAAGAFYRAFEELDDKKLVNFAGRYFDKSTMLSEYRKWLWMVDHAERWAQKRNWNLLYINDYLDTQRRDAKEMGFWYLEKQWKSNEKKKAKNKAKRAERCAEAQKRKKKIKLERVEKYGYRSIKPGTNSRSLSDYEKARKAVRSYLYGKMPFEELHRYCRHNLSQSIVDGLQNLIEAETKNLRKYNA